VYPVHTLRIQFTHSLNAPGFNPCTYEVISWFLITICCIRILNWYCYAEERLGKAERYFRKLGKVAGFESKLRQG
jgi:hypothetical protein